MEVAFQVHVAVEPRFEQADVAEEGRAQRHAPGAVEHQLEVGVLRGNDFIAKGPWRRGYAAAGPGGMGPASSFGTGTPE